MRQFATPRYARLHGQECKTCISDPRISLTTFVFSGVGLELAYNYRMNLHCKLVPVQYREPENGSVLAFLIGLKLIGHFRPRPRILGRGPSFSHISDHFTLGLRAHHLSGACFAHLLCVFDQRQANKCPVEQILSW